MKNRVDSVEEAKEIISDFHGRRIGIMSNYGSENMPIIRIIPMSSSNGESINDVEILLNKSKNTYFSIGMILKNKSWIKKIRLGGIDFKAKNQKTLWPFPKTDEVWIKTARFINLLKIIDSKGGYK